MFQDVPLFGEPEPEPPAVNLKMANEEHNKVHWRRFKAKGRYQCDVCRNEFLAGKRPGINEPTYVRLHLGVQLMLCFPHKQDQENRDRLDGLC
jgi:hypothetical protein